MQPHGALPYMSSRPAPTSAEQMANDDDDIINSDNVYDHNLRLDYGNRQRQYYLDGEHTLAVAAQHKAYDACTHATAPAAAHVNHRSTLPVGAHHDAEHTFGVCFEPRQATAAPAAGALSAAVPASTSLITTTSPTRAAAASTTSGFYTMTELHPDEAKARICASFKRCDLEHFRENSEQDKQTLTDRIQKYDEQLSKLTPGGLRYESMHRSMNKLSEDLVAAESGCRMTLEDLPLKHQGLYNNANNFNYHDPDLIIWGVCDSALVGKRFNGYATEIKYLGSRTERTGGGTKLLEVFLDRMLPAGKKSLVVLNAATMRVANWYKNHPFHFTYLGTGVHGFLPMLQYAKYPDAAAENWPKRDAFEQLLLLSENYGKNYQRQQTRIACTEGLAPMSDHHDSHGAAMTGGGMSTEGSSSQISPRLMDVAIDGVAPLSNFGIGDAQLFPLLEREPPPGMGAYLKHTEIPKVFYPTADHARSALQTTGFKRKGYVIIRSGVGRYVDAWRHLLTSTDFSRKFGDITNQEPQQFTVTKNGRAHTIARRLRQNTHPGACDDLHDVRDAFAAFFASPEDSPTLQVESISALRKGSAIDPSYPAAHDQPPHRDLDEDHCLLALAALTEGYEFDVYPGTHRTQGGVFDPSTRERLVLNKGDVVLFAGRLIHNGTGGNGLSLHAYGMRTHGEQTLYGYDARNKIYHLNTHDVSPSL